MVSVVRDAVSTPVDNAATNVVNPNDLSWITESLIDRAGEQHGSDSDAFAFSPVVRRSKKRLKRRTQQEYSYVGLGNCDGLRDPMDRSFDGFADSRTIVCQQERLQRPEVLENRVVRARWPCRVDDFRLTGRGGETDCLPGPTDSHAAAATDPDIRDLGSDEKLHPYAQRFD